MQKSRTSHGTPPKKYRSAMHYVLAAFIPYTESNLKLTFKPSMFFDDLSVYSKTHANQAMTQGAVRNAYYRAVKRGLVTIGTDGLPSLTHDGSRKLQFYQPKLLSGAARLLIVFDVPEAERAKRYRLRLILREFHFEQIQKSVWESKYDCIDFIRAAVEAEELENNVVLYEANRL